MKTPESATGIDGLFSAVENNEIPLPAMPDLAMKIQKILKDINVSNQQVSTAVSTDPVLASQIIKAANSALYLGKPKVDTLMEAIARIGFRMVGNIVTTFSMNKISNATHPIVKKHIAAFWKHSREVAAISYVLARNHKHLNQDQAMLAGLVHDIGTLPLCLYAEKTVRNLDDSLLDALLVKYRAKVGGRLLKDWQFPPELVEVVLAHEDLQRDTEDSLASYADIVTVANLLNPSSVKTTDWDNIAAVKRLYFTKDTCQSFFEIFENQLRTANEFFK
ncbi:MAG: HDOD domain-containing protein [Gallionella sp.]